MITKIEDLDSFFLDEFYSEAKTAALAITPHGRITDKTISVIILKYEQYKDKKWLRERLKEYIND